MIRLLYLAPFIGVVGLVIICYTIFVKPVAVNNKGEEVSATVAIEELKADLKKVITQQDLLASSIEAQRKDLLKESANASKLYDHTNSLEFQDMDLVKLKTSVNDFNQQALELAGNETAIIAFNDQLRDGVAALDKQISKIDFKDLLHPKSEVSNRLNSLKIQVAKLVELQKGIIAKSNEYNQRSREAIKDLKVKLIEQSQNMAALKTDRSAVLEQKIKDTISNQDQVLQNIEEQAKTLNTVRQQNMEQMEVSKERVTAMMEQMRSKMEDVKDKMETAKDRARDARDRAKDLQQQLKDRRNR